MGGRRVEGVNIYPKLGDLVKRLVSRLPVAKAHCSPGPFSSPNSVLLCLIAPASGDALEKLGSLADPL